VDGLCMKATKLENAEVMNWNRIENKRDSKDTGT
jgi:hypothetical protein